MRRITRETIKVDPIGCPWLITRFVDPNATFLFVPERELFAAAQREQATPFDARGRSIVRLDHGGERCTFEAILEDFAVDEALFRRLGLIVPAADAKASASPVLVIQEGPDVLSRCCPVRASARGKQPSKHLD